MKLFVTFSIAVMLASTCAAGYAAEERKEALDPNKPVAKINDTVITVGQVQDIIAGTPGDFKTLVKGRMDVFVKELVNREAMYQEAVRQGKDKDPELNRLFDMVKRQMIAELYIKRAVTDKVQVTEEEMKDYYEKNKGDFIIAPKPPAMRGVLVPYEDVREQIRSIVLQIKKKAAVDQYVDGLKSEMKIEVHQDVIDRME